MVHTTRVIIGICWAAWLAYWVIMAFRTKRTIERRGFIGYRIVGLAVVGAWFAIAALAGVSQQSQLWPTGLGLGVLTDCIVLAGAAFAIWARITLGRNWSAEVTFKQEHELIESGPYALVRHPIYTGLILMALGTAVNFARPLALAVFAALCASFWWKAREEERVMSSHFPDAYAEYKARVHAIIPFVL